MKISELSRTTGLPVGTIKYYLREGLLPAGRRTSRTTADYDASHAERLRLIRALVDVGGLDIAAVRRVVNVIDSPQPARLDVLATAQDALTSGDPAPCAGAMEPPDEVDRDPAPGEGTIGRAGSFLMERGWPVGPGDRLVARLEKTWSACEDAGIDVDEELMARYAEACLQVARIDVSTVPPEADRAVRRVVVGTVMMEPVLQALRLLAQRQVSVEDERGN